MATIAPVVAKKRMEEFVDIGEVESTEASPKLKQVEEAHAKPAHETFHVSTWTPLEVSSYLKDEGFATMAENAREMEVDGLTLQKLNPDGWRELSAPHDISNIQLAKIMAKLDRLAKANPIIEKSEELPRLFTEHHPELLEADKKKGENGMLNLFGEKTFEGGAEHTRQWLPR